MVLTPHPQYIGFISSFSAFPFPVVTKVEKKNIEIEALFYRLHFFTLHVRDSELWLNYSFHCVGLNTFAAM